MIMFSPCRRHFSQLSQAITSRRGLSHEASTKEYKTAKLYCCLCSPHAHTSEMGSLTLDCDNNSNCDSARWFLILMDIRLLGAIPFARQKLPVPDVPVTGPTQLDWTRLNVLKREGASHHVMMMMRGKQAENPKITLCS